MIAIRTSRRRSTLEVWRNVDRRQPANVEYCRAQGVRNLWLTPPWLRGTNRFYDLMGLSHGTLTNMDPATDWVNSPYGPAINFDGSNDEIYTGANGPTGSGPLTVFATFRTTSAAGAASNCLISFGDGLTAGALFAFAIESGVVWGRHASNTASGGSGYNDGQWHSATWSKPNGGGVTSVTLAADGRNLTTSTSGSTTLNFTAVNPIKIATYTHTPGAWFAGDIGCVIAMQNFWPNGGAFLHDQFRRGFPAYLNVLSRRMTSLPPSQGTIYEVDFESNLDFSTELEINLHTTQTLEENIVLVDQYGNSLQTTQYIENNIELQEQVENTLVTTQQLDDTLSLNDILLNTLITTQGVENTLDFIEEFLTSKSIFENIENTLSLTQTLFIPPSANDASWYFDLIQELVQ